MASSAFSLLRLNRALLRYLADLRLLIGAEFAFHHDVEQAFRLNLFERAAAETLAEFQAVGLLDAAFLAARFVKLHLIDGRRRRDEGQDVNDTDQHRLVDEVEGEAMPPGAGDDIAWRTGLTKTVQPAARRDEQGDGKTAKKGASHGSSGT